MKRIFKLIFIAFTVVIVLAACGDSNKTSDKKAGSSDESLQVISTFTLITDMVEQIGGELVDVHNLVPIGTDPHEYEPRPDDIKAATDADVLFYNGLNLEGGDHGWFARLIDAVGQDEANIIKLSEGVEPLYLSDKQGVDDQINPHSFLDPVVGIQMAENARDALIKIDPDNKEVYEKNAESYLNNLKDIDQEYKDKIAEIPEENRVLVSSERAYQYMAKRYGLEEAFIWDIDTEEQGTPEQITSLIKFIKDRKVPVLFVESNVDPRAMETVSKETGIEIFAEIFSDEIGMPGENGDTYVKFLKYNIEKIHDGLSK